MRGVVFLGNRKLELREFPDPTPGPGEVVVAMKASRTCRRPSWRRRPPRDPASDRETHAAPACGCRGKLRHAYVLLGGYPITIACSPGGSAHADDEARRGVDFPRDRARPLVVS